jgi:hypothetical protein
MPGAGAEAAAQPATARPAAILLSGPPAAVEGVVPVPALQRKTVRVEFDDGEALAEARVLTAPAGADSTLVRLVAADTTAPGRYQARVVADGTQLLAEVEVAAEPNVVFTPATLTFRCPPGGTDEVAIVISNLGNVAFEPRREYGFGLLEDGAVETAIGVSLRAERAGPGDSRVERFGDAVAERYGGLGFLHVVGGPKTIEPGSTVAATVEIRLTEDAKPGRKYHGLWEAEGASVSVSVETPRGTPITEANRRTRRSVAHEPATE